MCSSFHDQLLPIMLQPGTKIGLNKLAGDILSGQSLMIISRYYDPIMLISTSQKRCHQVLNHNVIYVKQSGQNFDFGQLELPVVNLVIICASENIFHIIIVILFFVLSVSMLSDNTNHHFKLID